jgi:hypothetical protein
MKKYAKQNAHTVYGLVRQRTYGPALSKLIAWVHPSRDPHEVVEMLLQLKPIRQVRKRYVRTSRTLILEGESMGFHALLALSTTARTIDHNIRHAPVRWARMLETTAINSRFPIRRLKELHEHLRERGKQIAADMDAQLLRDVVTPGSDEEFTRAIIGWYVGDDTLNGSSSEPVPPVPRRPTRRPRVRRPAARIEK